MSGRRGQKDHQPRWKAPQFECGEGRENQGHVDRPGDGPQAYAVYVDELDAVRLTDFTADAIVRFDPVTEEFESSPAERPPAAVRQLLGREGEVWGAESAGDRLVVVRYGE